MHLCRSSSNVPRLPWFLEMRQNLHVLLTFDKVHNPLRLPRETTSERPKVLRTRQFFALLTSKCASRHNGGHFFRHLNFQKWSDAGVFCTFWLRNVLRVTTACTFLTSQLLKPWGVFSFFTYKCASRHNGVHFFDIATSKVVRTWGVFTFSLTNVLRATTACTFLSLIWPDGSAPAALASLLFDPPEPQIIGKTRCFATFLPFHASGQMKSRAGKRQREEND